ncbi:MAG: hypothetical protein ACK5EN_03900, partial [Planctomyces sp.]
QLSVVSCQLSVVSCQLSVVSCQLSVVSCQLSVVSCQLSVVRHPTADVPYVFHAARAFQPEHFPCSKCEIFALRLC